MGVTNAFAKANALLLEELGFQLDPAAENLKFRQALYAAGWGRFEHAVKLTKLDSRKGATGAQKYARLMDLMRAVQPKKTEGTKYRNPGTAYGRKIHQAMDAEVMARVAREP